METYIPQESGQNICITDSQPPLLIQNEKTVFEEKGGADFKVTAVEALLRASSELITIHVASVKSGQSGVVCLIVTGEVDKERYLIARHWRAATRLWGWEFPRGMGEHGESIFETAKRELFEETGLSTSSANMTVLQRLHADSGILRDDIAVVEIRIPECELGDESMFGADSHDWELSNFRWLTVKEILLLIKQQQISDGITLAAFTIRECRNHNHY